MSSSEIRPQLEKITPKFFYKDLGIYVLDQLARVTQNSHEEFTKVFELSFIVSFLETSLDKEIRSRNHLLDRELIGKNIDAIVGLYIFKSCSRLARTKLQAGEPFESILDISTLISGAFQELKNPKNGLQFWQKVLQSVREFQALSRNAQTTFIDTSGPMTRAFSQALVQGIATPPIIKFADMFREATEQVFNPDPQQSSVLIQPHPETQHATITNLNTFNTTLSTDQIIRELKSI